MVDYQRGWRMPKFFLSWSRSVGGAAVSLPDRTSPTPGLCSDKASTAVLYADILIEPALAATTIFIHQGAGLTIR
jgi:hypothetical protein